MANFNDRFIPTESTSARFGESLGQGLQAIAQAKLQQLQQSRQASDLASVLGISPQEAQQYIRLGLDKDKLLSNWWQRGGGQTNNAVSAENPGTAAANEVGSSSAPNPSASRFSTPPLREQREQDKLNIAKRQEQRDIEKNENDLKEKAILHQEKLRPFFTKESEHFKAEKQARDYAVKMLDILQANKKDWPGAAKGNLPAAAMKLLLRNPAVREYEATGKNLVSSLLATRKGQPTGFKLKFEESGKAGLDQPIETQEALLQGIIDHYDDEAERQEYIQSLQDDQGNFPLDVSRKVDEFDRAIDEPLKYPSFFEEGTIYPHKNGQKFILENGKWKVMK
jgi:hypothetical protein